MEKEKAPTATESTDLDFSTNLYNITNGISSKNSVDMEVDKGDNKEEERSPAKKRGGSSKSSTKCKGTHQVSPPEQESLTSQQPTTSTSKTTTFLDNFIHPHSQIMLELAITLKSNKAFEDFTNALMAFITNAQIVDPKFFI